MDGIIESMGIGGDFPSNEEFLLADLQKEIESAVDLYRE